LLPGIDTFKPERDNILRMNTREEYDVVIIGAGPAGLFCALQTSAGRVLVLEKQGTAGKKLLIAGSGQCNITHEGEIRDFLNHYGDHGKFLQPALLSFSNRGLIGFFRDRGLSMIVAKGGKVFPETLRSQDILGILIEECREKGVMLRLSEEVVSVGRAGERFEVVSRKGTIVSDLLVIATGGASYPSTGSTGDGYRFLQSLGHTVTEIAPALTPVYVASYPFSEQAGVSFQEIEISLFREGKKVREHRGDVLLTHEGVSGPGILDLSRYIRAGDVIELSFVPLREREEFSRRFIQLLQKNSTKSVKNLLLEYDLPERLVKRILEYAGIPVEITGAHLTREARNVLIDHLTRFPLVVERLGNFREAMATRGGVSLDEVDPKSMESRLIPGLYCIGEVLDIDGDTGGYNLQAAFSTGALAGRSITKKISSRR